MESSVYLNSFLAPLAPILARSDVTDIYINKPKEIWIETLSGEIQRHECESLSATLLMRLTRQIAAGCAQGINREHPLLAATLPDGARVQIAIPPATRGEVAIAIRKHVTTGLSLDDYAAAGAYDNLQKGGKKLNDKHDFVAIDGTDAANILRDAVHTKRNIIVSGGTSSGKTTFLNALLREIPAQERLILIEDTPELKLFHPNAVGLIAARSELSEAHLTAEDLLTAALRMRPDRIILGELRGGEAFAFLRSVNTGHPGSMTTIHANSPLRAIEQLALLVLQTGVRLRWEDILNYTRASIDVFVQLERTGGKRHISEIVVRK